MAKTICVLYEDPITGYPKIYPRDDISTVCDEFLARVKRSERVCF